MAWSATRAQQPGAIASVDGFSLIGASLRAFAPAIIPAAGDGFNGGMSEVYDA